jgi:hypothetical protein
MDLILNAKGLGSVFVFTYHFYMRIDAQTPYEWQKINKALQEKLGCDSKVFLYRGLHQAIFETCLGLHLKFSHKRKLVAELGLSDHLKRTEIELSRLGVRLKNELDSDLEQEEKSILAYIHDLDDSLSGELYNHIDNLKKLVQTKIYRIHVAHHLFHYKKSFIKKLSDYDIMICSLDENYALVVTGDKINLPILTVGQLAWSFKSDFPKVEKIIDSEPCLFKDEILDFEGDLPADVNPWFDETSNRIYDRSVIILKNHDSAALMELLSKELGLTINPPGFVNKIESASYCRWENDSWFNQASFFSRTPEDLRGMLIVAGELINSDFKKAFKKSLDQLINLST